MKNIKKLFQDYKYNLTPTREQEDKMHMRIFASGKFSYSESTKNQNGSYINYFFNSNTMFKNRYGALLASVVIIVLFIAVPIGYLSIQRKGYNTSITGTDAPTNGTYKPMYIQNPANISDDERLNLSEDTLTPQGTRAVKQDGYFAFECSDIRSTYDEAKSIVNEFGGYIVSSAYYGEGNQSSLLVLRIPSDKFDSVIEKIRALDGQIVNESILTLDKQNQLTEALKIKETLESQITELQTKINQEQDASKKSELQKALESLNSRKSNNESVINSLSKEVDFSTIQISLKSKGFSLLSGDFRDLIKLGEYVLVFWLQVLIIVSIPLTLLVLLIKSIRKNRQNKTIKTLTK